MNLQEYYAQVVPLTREKFINLRRNTWRGRTEQEAFDNFCKRMNRGGGYGALQ